MIQDFSGGYYKMDMDIQAYDGGPVIESSLYNFIDHQIYSGQDVPVMMRLGLDAHDRFCVEREGAVPRDVLALPEYMFDETGESDVYLLKPEYSATLGEYYG